MLRTLRGFFAAAQNDILKIYVFVLDFPTLRPLRSNVRFFGGGIAVLLSSTPGAVESASLLLRFATSRNHRRPCILNT
jgi:hypothetical protein